MQLKTSNFCLIPYNWNLSALIGYYFRELFVIDFDTPKGSIHPDDDADVTVMMMQLLPW